jgi:hypothetical protein
MEQLKKIGIEVNVRTSPDFPTWARRIALAFLFPAHSETL